MSNVYEGHAIIGIDNRSWHRKFSLCPSQMRIFKQIKVDINLDFEAH